ncbi:dihydroorotase, partial [Enterococcus faecalis]
MNTLIKNGKIFKKENQLIEAALWLENGVIHAIGESLDVADFEQVFDANGQLNTPGLVDVLVLFREPGFTYKETIKTGSKA